MSVGEIIEINQNLKDRPAYVSFHRVSVEDVNASKRESRWIARDIDLVHITQPGSKDIFKQEIPAWLETLDNDMRNGRIPREWVEKYREAHQRWLKGQEIPLNGTPIKGWGVVSPAQQETIIHANVLTVEDLAVLNDDGMRRLGMGGMALKQKAQTWISQMNDKGPATMEIAALKNENALLKANQETLTRRLNELAAQVNHPVQPQATGIVVPIRDSINISEVLEDDYKAMEPPPIPQAIVPLEAPRGTSETRETLALQYETKYGKKPHHLLKAETIQARINQGVA